jgi:indolepyruvate decarboxylase
MKYYKQPIFIELLQDIADKPLLYDVYKQGTPSAPETDKEILEEALQDVVDWINEAQHPVILAGVELSRYGLGKDLLKFAERANIPIVTTLLSKSVVSETHPLSVGVYVGSGSNPRVQDVINESDCLLMLGVNNHGGFNYVPNKKQSICCSSEGLQVKNHQYINIGFEDFICSLFKTKLLRESLVVNIAKLDIKEFRPKTGVKITMARLFEKINSVLNANLAVVSDVGDALLGACELIIHQQNNFIATANYPSMGFAIPAALGLQTACPKVRPIIIVGDGAFQMSCMELGTIVSRRLNPIVLVLNNGGYASDRINGPFNDIHEWDYQEIVKVISGGQGAIAENEQELHSILSGALVQDSMYVINVKLDSKDISPVLLRMRKAKCNKA